MFQSVQCTPSSPPGLPVAPDALSDDGLPASPRPAETDRLKTQWHALLQSKCFSQAFHRQLSLPQCLQALQDAWKDRGGVGLYGKRNQHLTVGDRAVVVRNGAEDVRDLNPQNPVEPSKPKAGDDELSYLTCVPLSIDKGCVFFSVLQPSLKAVPALAVALCMDHELRAFSCGNPSKQSNHGPRYPFHRQFSHWLKDMKYNERYQRHTVEVATGVWMAMAQQLVSDDSERWLGATLARQLRSVHRSEAQSSTALFASALVGPGPAKPEHLELATVVRCSKELAGLEYRTMKAAGTNYDVQSPVFESWLGLWRSAVAQHLGLADLLNCSAFDRMCDIERLCLMSESERYDALPGRYSALSQNPLTLLGVHHQPSDTEVHSHSMALFQSMNKYNKRALLDLSKRSDRIFPFDDF